LGDSHTCYSHIARFGSGWLIPERCHDSKQQKESSEGKAGLEKEGVNMDASCWMGYSQTIIL
jgi:hypothetical protein